MPDSILTEEDSGDTQATRRELKIMAGASRLGDMRNAGNAVANHMEAFSIWADAEPNPFNDENREERFRKSLDAALKAVDAYVYLDSGVLLEHAQGALNLANTTNEFIGACSIVLMEARGSAPLDILAKMSQRLKKLRHAAEWLLHSAGWVLRMQSDQNLAEANTQAERAKRMRARRKAGFRMVSVAVHKTEVESLVNLGLLSQEDTDNSAAIEDALQAFHFAGFTAVYDNIDRLDNHWFKPADWRDAWLSRMIKFWTMFKMRV